MNLKTSPSAAMFEKVLRAFETRGITYSDVLAQLRRQLAANASPKELLAILRHRGSTERLPEYARLEAILLEALEGETVEHGPPDAASESESGVSKPSSSGPPASEPEPLEDEVAVDLDFNVFGRRAAARPSMRASELDLSVLARRLRSVDERVPARGVALEALTRSYERARQGESAAAEQATALAGDLEAARTALQTEQSKNREIEQALAARDVTLDQTRQVLGEKEARIATLAGERTILETELEARARAAAQLEAELRAARARAEAAAAELKARQEAAAALEARLERQAPPRKEREDSPPRRELKDSPPSDSKPLPPEHPKARPPGGSTRAIAWGSAAAALLFAGAWLLVHRSSQQPPPVASEEAPNSGTVIRDCSTCPGMTVLPQGRFKQGSASGSAYAQPLHWVVVGHPFAMSTNPVTLEDFQQFVDATGRDMQGCDTYDGEWKHRSEDSWERPGFAQTSTHPVTCVSWNDAEAYAQWLSGKTGHRYRLPSASEWEYAARAGAETPRPWGPDGTGACALGNVADLSAEHRYPGWAAFPCDDGYVYTAPVGAFKANKFGLNDMLGNVLQWTEDCWHGTYEGAPIDGSAWTDGDCSLHEIRGGSWASNPSYVRADYRDHFPADYRASSIGIRLIRDIEQ